MVDNLFILEILKEKQKKYLIGHRFLGDDIGDMEGDVGDDGIVIMVGGGDGDIAT
jgi:hypothetical protein